MCLESAVYVRDGGESDALVGALEDLPPGSLGCGRLAAEHRLRGRHLAGARHRGTEVPGHFTPLKPEDSLAADLACVFSKSVQTASHTVNKRAKTSDYYSIKRSNSCIYIELSLVQNSLMLS